jgi:hypothetical protein
MPTRSIALIGDRDPDVIAYRAISLATQFQLERASLNGRDHPWWQRLSLASNKQCRSLRAKTQYAKRESELRTDSARDEAA